jgi:hypothetical protein
MLRYEGLQTEYKQAWDKESRKPKWAIFIPLEEFVKYLGRIEERRTKKTTLFEVR